MDETGSLVVIVEHTLQRQPCRLYTSSVRQRVFKLTLCRRYDVCFLPRVKHTTCKHSFVSSFVRNVMTVSPDSKDITVLTLL
jgi:hypothetical protein